MAEIIFLILRNSDPNKSPRGPESNFIFCRLREGVKSVCGDSSGQLLNWSSVIMPKSNSFYQLKLEEEHEGRPMEDVSYMAVYKKLAKDTTGHGLPHINDARGWSFLVVLFFSGTFSHVGQLCAMWFHLLIRKSRKRKDLWNLLHWIFLCRFLQSIHLGCHHTCCSRMDGVSHVRHCRNLRQGWGFIR